jgi:hypothetical protein
VLPPLSEFVLASCGWASPGALLSELWGDPTGRLQQDVLQSFCLRNLRS